MLPTPIYSLTLARTGLKRQWSICMSNSDTRLAPFNTGSLQLLWNLDKMGDRRCLRLLLLL